MSSCVVVIMRMILWVAINVNSVIIVCFIIASEIDTHARPAYQLINMLNINSNMGVIGPNLNKYDGTIC